jgi:hypothetical protein
MGQSTPAKPVAVELSERNRQLVAPGLTATLLPNIQQLKLHCAARQAPVHLCDHQLLCLLL